MKYSILCPNLIKSDRGLEVAKVAFGSVMSNMGNDHELIIADGGSYPAGKSYIASLSGKNAMVKLISGKFRSYGEALNTAIKLATGRIIIPINNDIAVFPNWLKVMERHLAKPYVGMIHPETIGWEDKPDFGKLTATGKVPYFRGCLYGIRSEVVKEISDRNGGYFYRPEYYDGYGFDDWDFYLRLKALGYQLLWTNETQTRDYLGATIKDDPMTEAKREHNSTVFYKLWGKFWGELRWDNV